MTSEARSLLNDSGMYIKDRAAFRGPYALFGALAMIVLSWGDARAADNARNLSPDEALSAFKIEPGLRIELVASEPLVVDPVAFAFDERRRLYVVENRGYPDPLQSSGQPKTTKGRVALLEDTNGDGRYDRRTEFATGLGYPNGIMVWRGGVFVTAAPDIFYLKDTDGDGIADQRRVVLTGFEASKTAQIRVSYPTLGLDGWVYLASGMNGGKVYSPEYPERRPVEFKANDSRFHPDSLLFEVTGGNSQFGLAFDVFGRRFGVTNRSPVLHIVLGPRDLKRNRYLAFNSTVQEVSKVQSEAKVFPISQTKTASYWNQLYKPNPSRVPHAGTFTSACGIHIFGGVGLAPEHIGNVFICEPAQNLVQRQVFRPEGASFRTAPPYAGREFLASTDPMFRPVSLGTGPDGALYLADMHRREIDHPQYVPEEARTQMDFVGPEGTGRIYRIVREATGGAAVSTRKGSTVAELCQELESPVSWRRETAHRQLLERADPLAVPLLEKVATDAPLAASRTRAIWTLSSLGRLTPTLIAASMRDRDPGVREQAIVLSEKAGIEEANLLGPLLAVAEDSDARVRFVAALVLGSVKDSRVVPALAAIAARDGEDRWVRAAVLSGIEMRIEEFSAALGRMRNLKPAGFAATLENLSGVFGAGASMDTCRRFVGQMLAEDPELASCMPALNSLMEGMQGRADVGLKAGERPLTVLLSGNGQKESSVTLENFIRRAEALARDEKAPTRQRVNALALLGHADYHQVGPLLGELLDARHAPVLQLQAVRSLERLGDPRGGELLLQPRNWSGYTPQIRAAVIATLTSKPALIAVLFRAIERGDVKAAEIPSTRRTQLLQHSDLKVREGAKTVLKKLEGSDRMKVYQTFREILKQPVNAADGAEPFARVCASCHTYKGIGGTVGPDLTGVRNQSAEALLLHILVPNHEISPGYEAVSVTTRDGRSVSGWLASESDNSLTLRTPFNTEEVVSRQNIATFAASGVSLMPDGLEQTMTTEELARVIAYLRQEAESANNRTPPVKSSIP
jgi:putative membrane-bound dehydrogenase-like protein